MRWRRRTASVVATLVVAAGPALAAPPPAAHNFSSQVSVTGMRYELIDLNPGDGVGPSAEAVVHPGGPTSAGFATLEMGNRYGTVQRVSNTENPFGSAFVSALTSGGSAAAAVGHDASAGLGLFALGTGSTVGSKRDGVRTWFDARSNASGYGLQALVAPWTEMRWTGSFEALAMADRWWGTRMAQASEAVLHVFSGYAGDSTPDFQTFSATAFANPWLGGQVDREAGTFTFSFYNNSDLAIRFSGGVIANVTGGFKPTFASAVAPIPEPSTYALFAAGLLAVGVVTRRRAGRAD